MRSAATKKRVAFFAVLLLAAMPLCAKVGFFAPDGIPEATLDHTQIVLFNAENAEQVESNLRKVDGKRIAVLVDLGPMLVRPRDAAKVGMTYVAADGSTVTKLFAPEAHVKLGAFPSDRRMKEILDPVFAAMAKHAANVYAVMPVDEPYLNGITKSQLEHAGRVIRALLDQHGLSGVKLGAVFASGMFDQRFAHLMNRRAVDYVAGIDNYFKMAKADPKQAAALADWVKAIEKSRLTTYDQAGNMYLGGGLPHGYTLFGFDFYLSTLLLDGLHEDSLSWFARNYPSPECAGFAGLPMSKIRSKLSFFHDGPVLQGAQYRPADKRLLDSMYACRMGAMTTMITRAARGHRAKLLMISESGNNGALEFNAAGSPESGQPVKLNEARVRDEVDRAEAFYAKHECVYTAGLLFFTYADSFDSSINLKVGGAEAMPSVLQSIYRFASESNRVNAAGSKHGACSSH